MDCNKPKRSYHINVTEVAEGKIQEVLNFNFGGHHDIAALVQKAEQGEGVTPKHAAQLILGLRLLHHALKKYPDNAKFAAFLTQLDSFKQQLKADAKS